MGRQRNGHDRNLVILSGQLKIGCGRDAAMIVDASYVMPTTIKVKELRTDTVCNVYDCNSRLLNALILMFDCGLV